MNDGIKVIPAAFAVGREDVINERRGAQTIERVDFCNAYFSLVGSRRSAKRAAAFGVAARRSPQMNQQFWRARRGRELISRDVEDLRRHHGGDRSRKFGGGFPGGLSVSRGCQQRNGREPEKRGDFEHER